MSKPKLLFILFFLMFSTLTRIITYAERNFSSFCYLDVASFVATASEAHLSLPNGTDKVPSAKQGPVSLAKLFFEPKYYIAIHTFYSLELAAQPLLPFLSHIMPTPSRPPSAGSAS